MLDEILGDLQQLSKLIGDQSVIESNTGETAQKIVEITGTHGAAELDPAMQKILAIAFRSDLKVTSSLTFPDKNQEQRPAYTNIDIRSRYCLYF